MELRARKNKKQPATQIAGDDEISAEEATVLEDVTLVDDDSDFCAASSSAEDGDSDGSITGLFRPRSPTKSRNPVCVELPPRGDGLQTTTKRAKRKPPADDRTRMRRGEEKEKTASGSLQEESSSVFYSAEEDPAILVSRLQLLVPQLPTRRHWSHARGPAQIRLC